MGLEKKAEFFNGIPKVLHRILYVITLIYLEVLLHISVGESLFSLSTIYICLFSVIYGIVFYLLTTILNHFFVNFIGRSLLLLMIEIPYIVVYFLFCEFQLLYDLNTAFAGAGDAVADFSGDIISMIFSVSGMIHLIAFLLPFILYIIWGRKWDEFGNATWKQRGIAVMILVGVLLINSGLIAINSNVRNIFNKEYNYSAAVSEFGLITGIGLDYKNSVNGNTKEVAFEVTATTEVSKNSKQELLEDRQVVADEEVVTGQNVLDIDFNKLASDESSGCAEIDAYVASLKASSKNEFTGKFKGKNLIFLTAEAFTAEVIDKDLTPTLYRMATKGINFTDYYQPSSSGTTGGEYNNLMGLLPTAGGSSMKKTANNLNYMTIASRLSDLGYYGKAYHNNDYTFYDRDKTHVTLGYSAGYEGYGNGLEDCITEQWPESDLEMIKGTLNTYIHKKSFNIYYMTVSGHSLYSKSQNAMARKHWTQVEDLEYSDTVKAYLASQLELEDAMTYLINELEKAGIADDTVICISADHFPYGLDQDSNSMKYLSELYGESISNELYRDHNRLILWSGCLEDEAPVVVDTPTSSIDVLPTLLNLFGVEFDSRLLPGRDVFSDTEPLVFTLGYDWKTDLGTCINGKFTPANEKIAVSEDYVENIKTTVKNKITYCKSVLSKDYFRHVFED